MFNVTTKKKLNLQIRSQANQPAIETDVASIAESDLDKVLGGEGGAEMALGRTRSCGGGGDVEI